MSTLRDLDLMHLPPITKRKRSYEFEEFHQTAASNASQAHTQTEPPTPSPPSNAMPPGMYDVDEFDDGPNSDPPSFFSRNGAEPPNFPEAETDDRLKEMLSTRYTNTGKNRESAASTMTIANSSVENEDSDEQDSEGSLDEEEEPQPLPANKAKPASPKKRPQAESMETSEEEETQPPPPAKAKPAPHKKRARSESKELVQDSEDEEEVPPKKDLRRRTLAQQQPYKAEKVRYDMSKKNGGLKVDDSDVEYELLSTQRKVARSSNKIKTKATAKPAKAKKGRASNGRFSSVDTMGSPSITTSSAATPDIKEPVEDKTTLNIWHKGDVGGPNAINLAEVPTITALFDHIDGTWGRVKGGKTTRIECMLPWKEDDKNLLVIYPGWDTSFRRLLELIHNAPVWRKKGKNELEVKLVATLG